MTGCARTFLAQILIMASQAAARAAFYLPGEGGPDAYPMLHLCVDASGRSPVASQVAAVRCGSSEQLTSCQLLGQENLQSLLEWSWLRRHAMLLDELCCGVVCEVCTEPGHDSALHSQ
jgi:hypothetical protein